MGGGGPCGVPGLASSMRRWCRHAGWCAAPVPWQLLLQPAAQSHQSQRPPSIFFVDRDCLCQVSGLVHIVAA